MDCEPVPFLLRLFVVAIPLWGAVGVTGVCLRLL